MSKKQTNYPDKVRIQARWDKAAVAIGHGETHLVLTIETPMIKRNAGRAPVDVAFVIDRSGSMSGEPLELAKRGVAEALTLLDDKDAFAVVAYDNEVRDTVRFTNASRENRQWAAGAIRELCAGGSTDLFGGWYRGCEHLHEPGGYPAAVRGRIKRTILLSDGMANVGETDPGRISFRVTRERQLGIVTSTLGLGAGTDELLMTSMAEAGGGAYAYAATAADLPAFFMRELGEALTVIASGASLSLTLPKGVRVTLLNPFPVEREGKQLTVALGDLFAGMTLNLVFAITTRAKAAVVYGTFDLAGTWTGRDGERMTDRAVSIPVDTLMAMPADEVYAMPADAAVSKIAGEMLASQAKREAMYAYRDGDAIRAQTSLRTMQSKLSAMPAAAPLAHELTTLAEADYATPEFSELRRQILNDEHRVARGRER